MPDKINQYEALYIVRPDIADSDLTKLSDRFKQVVESKGGEVESAAKWDKRKLAYPIGVHKEGVYMLMKFTSKPDVPAELNRLMRISDDVLRQMITTGKSS